MHGRLDRKAHFEALREHLLASAQTCAHAQGVNRAVQATAHEDCLAVSWSGDREHRTALAFQRDWAVREKSLDSAQRISGRRIGAAAREEENQAVADACRARYDGKLDTAYSHEAYVFQKTSEVPPRAVETVAPGLMGEIGSVPLHHYYLIAREQPAVDVGETPVFTRWRVESKTYSTLDGVVSALVARMFPERCPPMSRPAVQPPNLLFFWLLGAVVLGAVILGAGVFIERSKWFQEITGRFEDLEGELQSIDASLAGLTARHAALEADLAALAGDVARREDVERILEELARLEQAMGEAGDGPGDLGALGHAPCAYTPRADAAPALAYLARVQVAEDGLRVHPWSGPAPARGADLRASALETLDFRAPQPMDAQAFRAWSAEAHAQSREADCRHYVVLHETGTGDAAGYAALRDAVEDNFYIFRPSP